MRRHAAALAHLRRDPALARVLETVGPCTFEPTPVETFAALAESIVHQQISGAAAGAIWGRLSALLGGAVTAERFVEHDDIAVRGAGLSGPKIASLQALATAHAEGRLPTLAALDAMDDEAIVTTLTELRGVGRWTAEMFLIFRLGRPDVLPVHDLGVRKAVQRAFRLRALPTPERVAQLGERWRPHRTLATWYLWRSLGGIVLAAKPKTRSASAALSRPRRPAR